MRRTWLNWPVSQLKSQQIILSSRISMDIHFLNNWDKSFKE